MATAHEDWRKFNYIRGRSATRTFIVTQATDGNDAIAATPVAANAPYPLDGTLKARPDPVVTMEGPTTFVVAWGFEPPAGANGEHPDPADKLSQPAEFTWLPGSYTEEVDADRHGNPIANLAGSVLDPRARKTYNTLDLEITRYYSNFQIGFALQFMNRVNKDAFSIAGFGTVEAECCKCLYIAPAERIQMGSPNPVKVTHRFEVRGNLVTGLSEDPGFKHRVVNRGRMAWYVGNDDVPRLGRITVKGVNGWEPVAEDVLLSGGGLPYYRTFKVEDGKEPIPNPDGAPRNVEVTTGVVHLLFDIEDTVDFAPLIAAL